MPSVPQREINPAQLTGGAAPVPSDVLLEDGSGMFELEDNSGQVALE